jgi:hypothetical protein
MRQDTKSRIAAAKVRLGIKTETWTESDVRLACATKLREYHPDSAGMTKPDSGVKIAKVKSDRALLLRFATPDDVVKNACPRCGGTGYVQD